MTGSNATIAVLMPGDMGHAVGWALRDHGLDVITCLAGRSGHSKAHAARAGFRGVPDMDAVVREASMVLSILPPAEAVAQAKRVADAMARTGAKPVYVECNAIAPETALAAAGPIEAQGAAFIDAGIIGTKPAKADGGWAPGPRFYVSGADTGPMGALDGFGFRVVSLGPEPGRASAIKMCYAGLTKGTWTLQTAVLLAAERMGLSEELRQEFEMSQAQAVAMMEARIPRLPADSGRWIGEMEEIAKAFADAGVTPGFHQGATEIFRILAETPYAAETRETFDETRNVAETVRAAAAALADRLAKTERN